MNIHKDVTHNFSWKSNNIAKIDEATLLKCSKNFKLSRSIDLVIYNVTLYFSNYETA